MDRTEASWIGLVEHAFELEPDPQYEHLTDEQLELEVRGGASKIAAMMARWLLHIGEFVVRGAWGEQGARTPGQWLSWACGVDGRTGREYVRIALALRDLPKIRARFLEGTISYSKVRAITRGASPEIEDDLLQLADSAPASHVDRILSLARRSADETERWAEGPPPPPGGEVRDLRRVVVGDGVTELRIRLPDDEAVAVEDRLDRLVDVADRADTASATAPSLEEHASDATTQERPSRGARRAAALCDALAVAVAAGPPDRSGVDDHLVVLHVEAAEVVAAAAGPAEPPRTAGPAGPRRSARPNGVGQRRHHIATGRGRAMRLPSSVLARLACDADLRLAGIADDGHPADIGRRSRKVPPDLRRALQLRDRHCRFPGCQRTRGVHAHHVVHWAVGGPTDLANLVLLCAHHHQFVHDRGWTLRAVDPLAGRWTFHAPDDDTALAPVLPLPRASAAGLAHDPLAQGDPPPYALQPPWWDGGPYDLSETVRMVADHLLHARAA